MPLVEMAHISSVVDHLLLALPLVLIHLPQPLARLLVLRTHTTFWRGQRRTHTLGVVDGGEGLLELTAWAQCPEDWVEHPECALRPMTVQMRLVLHHH